MLQGTQRNTQPSIVVITLSVMTGLLIHYMEISPRYLNRLLLSAILATTFPRPSYNFSLICDVEDLETVGKIVEPLNEKLPTLASCTRSSDPGNKMDLESSEFI